MAKTTPCGVLYSVLGEAADTKRYEDFDHRIISREPLSPGERSPYERVSSVRSFRTREIIQKDPHELNPKLFCSPYTAANNLVSYLKRTGLSMQDIIDKFSGEYTDYMVQALEDWGYNHHLFKNKMADLCRSKETPTVMATAVLMLFLATAFFGDPAVSVPGFESEARRNGLFVKTCTSVASTQDVADLDEITSERASMGLQRKHRDGSLGQTYLLSEAEDGTIIGRTEAHGYVINDVDEKVSRNHLRVWKEDDFWFAQGQGSTNGSWVIREDGTEEVIEEPKKTRPRSALAPIVEIGPGDTLQLGPGTFFNVVPIRR